jgi:hypothetical protein
LKQLLYSCCFLFISQFLWNCAQRSGPTGGPKDETPPQIVMSVPKNFSTQYNGNTIILVFDEYVQEKNLREQLVITPSLPKQAETTLKKKTLSIYIGDSLKPSTTYQINLGDGIVDNTEGNILDSNLFVFSTGTYIDSLSIKGEVKDAFTNVPREGMLVLLYEDLEDSVPLTKLPSYFSKTNKDGKFQINYIKQGTYKLFALKDENRNYLFDLPDEIIAFENNAILVDNDSLFFSLKSFQEYYPKQYISSSKQPGYGRIQLVFNEPTTLPEINLLNGSFKKSWFLDDLYTNKDTLDLWLSEMESLDTLKMIISDNGQIIDTLEMLVSKKNPPKKMNITLKNNEISPFQSLFLISSQPILNHQLDNSYIVINETDTVDLKIKNLKKASREIELDLAIEENNSYHVFIAPNSFQGLFSFQTDTIRLKAKVKAKNLFANLTIVPEITEADSSIQYLLQLYNGKGTLINKPKVVYSLEKVTYENLLGGEYSLKLIVDDNKSGVWDTGKYIEQRQPERVVIYQEKINIRGGWDNEIIWKIEY